LAIDDIISTTPKNRREGGGSRRSASRALMFGTLAVVAGGGAAVMLKSYVDKHQGSAQAMTPVVVAAMDLPLATTLKAEHLTVVAWPSAARPAGTFTDPKELLGRVLVTKMYNTELVLAVKLAAREAGSGLAALIPENMRAAAVRVDDVVGVAGFIHPEDRVDVIVTMRPEQGGETSSKVILQNIRVLAVGKEIQVEDQSRNKALPVTVATLLVTTEQSEKLALAAAQGKLLLTLRSWSDQNEVATTGIGPVALLAGGRPSVPEPVKPTKAVESPRHVSRRPDKAATPSPAAPAERKDVVEILRGDRFEERKFDEKEKP
jgi:pilus assembly protein CpaB